MLKNENIVYLGLLLVLEFTFKLLAFGSLGLLDSIRVFLIVVSFSIVTWMIGELFKEKKKAFYFGILLFFGLYSFIEIELKHFLGNFMSINAAIDGLARIGQYIVQFILYAKIEYYLLFIPAIVMLMYMRKYKEDHPMDWVKFGILGCIAIFTFSLSKYTLYMDNGIISLVSLYENPHLLDKSLKEFGLLKFFERDLISLKNQRNEELVITEYEEEEEEVIKDYVRVIDDSEWIKLKDQESDEDIKAIDEYLLKQKITDKNEMTGTLEGYNLIYIMVEAFDYIAIDEQLTPTLYKMQQNGYHFDNYYTPKYSCTTGESEFIGLTSLVPQSDLCTPNSYASNAYPSSILSMFKKEGYYVSAYHNWKDEFYERRTLYSSMGCDNYYNLDDLDIKIVQGWQSDDELIDLALPHFVDKEPFMSLIVTSSMHFPYDSYSVIGERYFDEINEVYPDYPLEIKRYLSKAIELDKALERLLDELEKKELLDHTLIVLFADHHPLKTDISTLIKYTQQFDRSVGMNEDKTPAFMYSPSLEAKSLDKVASTYDLLPTLLNLYGIDFDPRLYIGKDYFAPGTSVAIFPDGSWISDEGIYYLDKGTFEGEEVSENYLKYYNSYVSNSFSISKRIYHSDYFSKRTLWEDK
ncbi:MAG: LTA synthase family protein [Erysipelotrichaceae bacterium]|nr:LTA synthase family protein [Erysipelotrichaceae bacterium]